MCSFIPIRSSGGKVALQQRLTRTEIHQDGNRCRATGAVEEVAQLDRGPDALSSRVATPNRPRLLPAPQSPQSVLSTKEVWSELDCVLVLLDCFWNASRLLQSDSEIVVRLGVIRFEA